MCCIYGFFDRNGTIFYVGQTVDLKNRLSNHKVEINKGNKLYCYNKIRKEIRETGKNFKDFVGIIENDVEKDKLDERETFHIRNFRIQGYKLTNLTDGGRGSIGFSEQTQKKAAAKRIGHKFSEETRKKLSEARKGMKFSAEHLKNLSIARRKRTISEESRKKASLTSKGKINIKIFKAIDPEGKEFLTKEGLKKFCEDRGLSASNLHRVLGGKCKQHKGWKLERIHENAIPFELHNN